MAPRKKNSRIVLGQPPAHWVTSGQLPHPLGLGLSICRMGTTSLCPPHRDSWDHRCESNMTLKHVDGSRELGTGG